MNSRFNDRLSQLRLLVKPWIGLEGKLWEYHATHWMLDIMIEDPDKLNLHIVCEGVRSIVAKPCWESADVTFVVDLEHDHGATYRGGFRVVDSSGGLNILCELIRLETRVYGSHASTILDEVAYYL